VIFFRSINRKLEMIMAQIDDLNTAIATLQTDVNTLIASQKPVDLTAAIAAVNAVDATVKAATPAP
jgi:prefoldin subunit 5